MDILLDDKSDGIHMKIVFKRVIMNEVLTTYLPTGLLIIISYSTTFFCGRLFWSKSNCESVSDVCDDNSLCQCQKLPRTSYIRMVDVWLIYGQLFPFLEVVLVTFTEYYTVRGKVIDKSCKDKKDESMPAICNKVS